MYFNQNKLQQSNSSVGVGVDGWVGVKAVLRIAYSNQKFKN